MFRCAGEPYDPNTHSLHRARNLAVQEEEVEARFTAAGETSYKHSKTILSQVSKTSNMQTYRSNC